MTDDIDTALANNTRDEEYTTVTENYYQDQLGKRWWDTSKVTYYDYLTEESIYMFKENWGKLFLDSIDAYEWTKQQ